ncbi:zinc metalloproteinase nas-14-like [Macrobrachium rosenbergii]|uniref:zinc metalloproteinase nas-14-like n=1 Tax=Macrobrachium rosenbergii TaxID=79674 RepID=UPI0034D5F3B9
MLQIIFLQLVAFASPGIAAAGAEDKKNILHAMATLPTLDPTLRVDKTVQNITDSLSIHENKGEYFPTKGDDRAEELAIETEGYRFINAYLNRKLLSKGAKESFSNTESWEEDKVRKYSADDEREKYSLPNEGKGEDYLRNNSMEEDYQGNQDKNEEYSNNEGSEKDKVRNDDVREKYSHSNESKVEDRTRSRSSEEDYQGNKGEGGEYSDNGNEDWEKYFQANKDKEEDFSNNGGWKEDFPSTDDKSITLAINNEDKAKQPMKTAEELAKWAEDIQNAEGHSVERRSSEDCQDEDGPCEPHPGNGTLDSTLHSRDRSSLWPYGVKTGYPLVPYRFLITDPALVRLFEESISEWDSATCIDFVRVTAENEKILGTWEFLNIVSHPLRCLFRFGKEKERSQTLFLHKSCQTKEEIVRGLGIALGIHYQFLRPDRDEYLHINQDNANDEFPKFQVDELADSNVPFDYLSAMQPHGVWSSRDGKVTFSTKDIKYQGLLGRSGGSISHRDKLIVNKLYGCLDRWRSSCNSEGTL